MTLTLEHFDEFFATLHGQGRSPYRWQTELLERLLTTGRWPMELDIPTGGGKSTAIEIHVFANAIAQQLTETGAADAPRIPRRLSMIVARRAVVDDHLGRATALMEALTNAESGILAEVRELLVRRSYPAAFPEQEKKPLRVHLLRGGSAAITDDGRLGRRRDEWIHHPTAVQILCGTPDMIGSRLLHRGYGVSPKTRPRPAGLLGYDHVAVLDEAHLSRQLLDTFRRVSQMCSRWNPATANIPALQICAATATHAGTEESGTAHHFVPPGDRLSLDWDQLEPSLSNILTHPKPVEYLESAEWNSDAKKGLEAHASLILDRAEALRDGVSGVIGMVVNRVRTAVAVQELAEKSGLSTRLLVGPQRVGEPRDLQLEDADLVVATQTIEVGVDVDFAGMVTDLAPGSSLIQRVGRVNRRGQREYGPVIVIGPEGTGPVPSPAALPYEGEDLGQAREWIRQLAQEDEGLSPLNLRRRDVPPTSPTRPVFSHLDDADARLLARTSEQMFAEPDLTFWLRDSLDTDEQEIRVIGRELPKLVPGLTSALKSEVVDATFQLLHQLEYEDQEIYPSTPEKVHKALTRKGVDSALQAWVHRDGGWTLMRPHREENLPHAVAASSFPLRGGDLVVLDADFPCTMGVSADEATGAEGAGAVFHPEGDRRIGDHSRPDAMEVYTYLHQIPANADGQESLGTLVCRAAEEAEPDEDGAILIEDLPIPDITSEGTAYDVILGPPSAATDGSPVWVVCTARTELAQEEPLKGHSTDESDEPVLLKDHQQHVSTRAADIADLLHLPGDVQEALQAAGLHHDEGKSAPGFQAKLVVEGKRTGAGPSSEERRPLAERQEKMLLAKSTGVLRLPPTPSRKPSPQGWRHEMLSAAKYWSDHPQTGFPLPETAGPRELTTWLIGTHHGLGRSGFAVGEAMVLAAQLPAGDEWSGVPEAVRSLYGDGLWEDLAALMERTFGPWATSYLEALLRAADVTISQEGR